MIVPLLHETLGGLGRDGRRALNFLHELADPKTCDDRTTYGAARSATCSFRTHHLRAISLAIHTRNMDILLAAADRENRRCAQAHSPDTSPGSPDAD